MTKLVDYAMIGLPVVLAVYFVFLWIEDAPGFREGLLGAGALLLAAYAIGKAATLLTQAYRATKGAR